MIRMLLLGFQTAGAIRYTLFTVIAGFWALIFAVGAVRVAVAGDWVDAVLLVLCVGGLSLSARHYCRITRGRVNALR